MHRFRAIVLAAALAGLVGGVFMTLVQQVGTVPLILQAETYEAAGAVAHEHAAPGEAAPWTPSDGAERSLLTLVANVVTATGFALLLISGIALRGGAIGWRQGMLWGMGGFAVFSLAPFLGLPPELPGIPSAELGARQGWWLLTVLATAAGLALIALRRSPLATLAAAALLVFPHLVGAPQPAGHESPIPPELLRSFVVAVTLSSLLFWLLLGVSCTWCWRHLGGAAERPA